MFVRSLVSLAVSYMATYMCMYGQQNEFIIFVYRWAAFLSADMC